MLVVSVAAVCGVLSVVFNYNNRYTLVGKFMFAAYTILLSAVMMKCMTLWVG